MNSGTTVTNESTLGGHEKPAGARESPSLSDAIGERTVVFDETGAPVLELLRFRQTLTAIPGFEVALRRRVERLRHFRHPLFAKTPTVEYLDQDRRLSLVSPHTPGRRLSTVLGHAQDPELAASLVHQLVPALETLASYGDGVGHGALTSSRIVISPDGSPIVIEHVLGPALERLHLGGATDCFQLAVIAISMLLGRPLTKDEYLDPVARTLDAALPTNAESGDASRGLRTWLERALRQDHRGFLSAEEAKAALSSVSPPGPAVAHLWRGLLDVPEDAPEEAPEEHPAREIAVAPVPVAPVPTPASSEEIAPLPLPVIAEASPAPAAAEPTQHLSAVPELVRKRLQHSFRVPTGGIRWDIAALAALAVVEALVIAVLLAGRSRVPPQSSVAEINLVTAEPGSPVVVDGQTAGVTPLRLTINSDMRSISVASAPRSAPTQEAIVGSTGQQNSPVEMAREGAAANARARSAAAVVDAPRIGRIKVSSPIALEIFEGDTRLGSTEAGVVSAVAGRRELDFVNSTLGFRSRQVVDVKPGQIAAVAVSPPDGRININAVPWAEVLIDGKLIGETPIGNLSIPLGEHQIVFRHPKLGEVRRTAVVRSDGVTRVSANLER